MIEQCIPRRKKRRKAPQILCGFWLEYSWLDDPSPPSSPPSGLKPHDNSLIFLHSLSVVSLLTARPPDRLEVTELTWIHPLSPHPTLRKASPSRRTHGYTSGQTAVSATHRQPAPRGVAAAAASNTSSTPSSPILLRLLLVESDMADPSLTSPTGTPLRSPNTSLTLSFPFLRERSRVWEEGKEQPLPTDLPSPLPTKRTRTYSA